MKVTKSVKTHLGKEGIKILGEADRKKVENKHAVMMLAPLVVWRGREARITFYFMMVRTLSMRSTLFTKSQV